MKKSLTELLGCKYPIIQGAMQHLSYAEFAAAASNAGALGTINAAMHKTKESFVAEIRKTQKLTKNPFMVNISLLPELTQADMEKMYFTTAIEEGVKIIETSGRNPEAYVPMIKEANVKLIHKVPAVRFAKKAESIGVDAVTIVGYECGGHPGMDDVTSMILIPKAAQELSIPVIAGGGIIDSRGYVAARALGAQGVVVGTRFAATTECALHQNFKDLIINAKETDTMLVQKSIRNALRTYKTQGAAKVLEMEKRGTTLEELMTVISGNITKQCYADGDTQRCLFAIGQSAGLIHEIKSVKEVIEEIMTGAQQILGDLNQNILK